MKKTVTVQITATDIQRRLAISQKSSQQSASFLPIPFEGFSGSECIVGAFPSMAYWQRAVENHRNINNEIVAASIQLFKECTTRHSMLWITLNLWNKSCFQLLFFQTQTELDKMRVHIVTLFLSTSLLQRHKE